MAHAELARLRHGFLSSPEELIEEAKNGRIFILVDDEDRENEGDLVVPAQMATPEKINFMAKHGRGLICLALTKKRVDELGLQLMSRNNGTRYETAFTTSIEARDGVTTGISAADRARTVSVAIDAGKGRDEIVTPGHVFPLVARDGGVLVRTGHTEAAVDVVAARRPQSLRRDLRDHERGRDDGAAGRPGRLCAAPQPEDRDDPGSDRLSPPPRSSCREARRGEVHQPLGRRLDRADLSGTRRPAPSRSRW